MQLILGDCSAKLKEIPAHSVPLILTDPPYGLTQNKWDTALPFYNTAIYKGRSFEKNEFLLAALKDGMSYDDAVNLWNGNHHKGLWDKIDRVLAPNGCVILFSGGCFTAYLMKGNTIPWRYNLIWQKTQPVGFLNAHRMPLRAHEDICVFYHHIPTYNPQKTDGHPRKVSSIVHKRNSSHGTNYGQFQSFSYDSTERYPTSVLRYPSDKQKGHFHPTQKPVALCEFLIRSYSNPDDTVLDFCMGSGSTGVAAINTGRDFIGIELSSEYYAAAVKRIEEAKEGYGKTEIHTES